tara:strand:- start:1662 stop:1832 length:171 start_codon:yes stop_codon:yes gene_type:complete
MTAIIYNFMEEVVKLYNEKKVSVQSLLRIEMLELGYDPNKKEDCLKFYKNTTRKNT